MRGDAAAIAEIVQTVLPAIYDHGVVEAVREGREQQPIRPRFSTRSPAMSWSSTRTPFGASRRRPDNDGRCCGRADLVRALASGDADTVVAIAELLGFARQEPVLGKGAVALGAITGAALGIVKAPSGEVKEQAKPLVDVPFWRADLFESVSAAPLEESPVAEVDVTWDTRPAVSAPIHLLGPWRELQPRLRAEATEPRETTNVDVVAVVRRLSEGRLLDRVPREHRRHWGPRLQLIVDRSERLVPYWTDQDLVASALARLVPEHTLELAVFWEGLREPRIAGAGQALLPYRLPPPGNLVLGDLGCLAAGDRLPQRIWCDLGRRLVSPAVRIEPGFLRAVRLLLPPEEADAATEADVWQHPVVTGTSVDGATLDPEEASALCAAFARDAEQEPGLHRKVLALLRAWRGHLPAEVWFEEIQSLAPVARRLLPDPADVELSQRFFAQLSQRARGVVPGAAVGALPWFRRCERRLTPSAWTDPAIGAALHKLSWALHGQEAGFRPGAGFDPAMIAATRERRLGASHAGAMLTVAELSDPAVPESGGRSPLAGLRSGNGLVQVAEVRGGSWNLYARICRCACRGGSGPGERDDDLGFRCARAQVREPGGKEEEAPVRDGVLGKLRSWIRGPKDKGDEGPR